MVAIWSLHAKLKGFYYSLHLPFFNSCLKNNYKHLVSKTMSIFDVIFDLLKQKENFAIAAIINHNGSSPLNVGTRMLIHRDKTIIGTIGGGILEVYDKDCQAF